MQFWAWGKSIAFRNAYLRTHEEGGEDGGDLGSSVCFFDVDMNEYCVARVLTASSVSALLSHIVRPLWCWQTHYCTTDGGGS